MTDELSPAEKAAVRAGYATGHPTPDSSASIYAFAVSEALRSEWVAKVTAAQCAVVHTDSNSESECRGFNSALDYVAELLEVRP